MSTPTIDERCDAQQATITVAYNSADWDMRRTRTHLLTADELRAVLVELEKLRSAERLARVQLNISRQQRDQWRECATSLRRSAPAGQCEDFHHSRKDRHDGHEDCPCLDRYIQALARFDALVKEAE